MPDPEIRVRPASADDVAAIYRLAAAHDVHLEGPDGLGTPYLDRLFSDGTILVAERRGTVVGFAAAASSEPAAPWGCASAGRIRP